MKRKHSIYKVIKRRCDKSMKRSKERTGNWKCNEDCVNCFCCIEMDDDVFGEEAHFDIRRVRKNERLSKNKE